MTTLKENKMFKLPEYHEMDKKHYSELKELPHITPQGHLIFPSPGARLKTLFLRIMKRCELIHTKCMFYKLPWFANPHQLSWEIQMRIHEHSLREENIGKPYFMKTSVFRNILMEVSKLISRNDENFLKLSRRLAEIFDDETYFM